MSTSKQVWQLSDYMLHMKIARKRTNTIGTGEIPKILVTEDGFPVNTVYVNFGRNPMFCRENIVRKMFEKFGPVKEVRIITKLNNDRFGFVSYERCEDALQCLQKYDFPLMYLGAADSWQQDAYKKKTTPVLTEPDSMFKEPAGSCSVESKPGNEVSNILQLNDDCLMLIFNQLDLMDLIALNNTCTRLASVVCGVLRRYKSFDFTEPREKPSLTVMDTKNILENVGPFVERLSMSGHRFVRSEATNTFRILSLIPRNCLYLKELKIHSFDLNPSFLNALEVAIKSLEALTLDSCDVDDYVERCLSHCQSLQRLQLSNNHTLVGTCLRGIKGLKSLNVANCFNLNSPKLFVFLQNNPQLEYLNVTGCRELNTNVINTICRLTELTHLACDDGYSKVALTTMVLIAQIPKIRRLELTIKHSQSADQIFRMFAERNCLEYMELKISGCLVPTKFTIHYNVILEMTKLKELKIHGCDWHGEHLGQFCRPTNIERMHYINCYLTSQSELIEFVKKNPQLKQLYISGVFLTEKFISLVLDALHQNGSFLEVIVEDATWRRLQRIMVDLTTLLKDNCRWLKVKVASKENAHKITPYRCL